MYPSSSSTRQCNGNVGTATALPHLLRKPAPGATARGCARECHIFSVADKTASPVSMKSVDMWAPVPKQRFVTPLLRLSESPLLVVNDVRILPNNSPSEDRT